MALGAQGSGMAGVQARPPAGPFPAPSRLSGIASCGGTRPVCGSQDTAVTGPAASRGLLFGISFLAAGLGSRAACRFPAPNAAQPPRARAPQRPPGRASVWSHCRSSRSVSPHTLATGPETAVTQLRPREDKGVEEDPEPDHSESSGAIALAFPEPLTTETEMTEQSS